MQKDMCMQLETLASWQLVVVTLCGVYAARDTGIMATCDDTV